MFKSTTNIIGLIGSILIMGAGCKIPAAQQADHRAGIPSAYASGSQDSVNTGNTRWKDYFSDPYLALLIDSALQRNQELNISLQEIEIVRNEIKVRKSELLPFAAIRGAAGVEKAARYTSKGASEATTDIKPGKEMPEPLPDYALAVYARWEVDVWHKLRNAKKAAISRYLASVEGRNFAITNLVAEIANSYYELLALDQQLSIVKQNISIQTNALEIVKLQKQAARTTELAVRKFEAEVAKTRSLEFTIQQQIVEAENRINFLTGTYSHSVTRNDSAFVLPITPAAMGLPSQLLLNRPDIRQAELELQAAKLDVQVARAAFYPSLAVTASLGYQAFSLSDLFKTPESVLYSLAGDVIAPLINKNAIKAAYATANAKQLQVVYRYQQAVLNAYFEVVNQMSKINNLEKSYALQRRQVDALKESIDISNELFRSARADYMEVLMTQRDALESTFELVETRKQQLNAMVNVYKALGGGWK